MVLGRSTPHHLLAAAFGGIANKYHDWIDDYAAKRQLDILQPQQNPDLLKVSREDLVEPYFQKLGQHEGVAVILKLREPERIACYHARTNDIAIMRRNVLLYYFYLNDRDCGRMFLRICPYFPFNITIWLNGHNWLKQQLDHEAIAYQSCDNLFTACERPERLQQLSDAFAPEHIVHSVDAWMERLLPFFSPAERLEGFRHQLYMTQIEYCNNLVFDKRPDPAPPLRPPVRRQSWPRSSRQAGHHLRPRNFVPDTRTGETTLKITKLRLPVLKASYKHTDLKQYGKDGGHNVAALRTEGSCFQLKDLSVRKHLDNLPKMRARFCMAPISVVWISNKTC